MSGLMHGHDVEGARRVFEGKLGEGYFMNGTLEEGLKVFREMPGKDVISWNLVIEGLLNCEKFDLKRIEL
ncbi:Uncharacterized protein TCM_021005 [Theobroma cacao]|uniref:Pentatricopeptide repeat-containing protein n=1 Tax=Theobroma cacao TaxID=3641 RepID=A0A061EMG6_THECC|nr:Uncharacterized protein TCM_021005 [Theobroma cacao]